MIHAIIPSIFTERVCGFPSLEEELKKPSTLLTIVLDGYDDLIKKQANKLQSSLAIASINQDIRFKLLL